MLRRVAVLALGCATLSGAVFATRAALAREDPPAKPFEQGLEAYRRGDLASARTLWLELLEAAGEKTADERTRAVLLYDLGNVAYREGRPLEAAAWYTACLRVEPRHEGAWVNLELSREKANVPPADRGDLLATLRRLLSALTLAESEWLALGLGALLNAVLVFEALRGGPLARRLALGAVLLCALAFAPWVYNLRQARRDPWFVVSAEGAPVHSEPGADAAVVARLAPASETERRDELPGWVRVAGPGSVEGWVERDALFALEGPYRREAP